jgi:3-oxoadipate enol-lactonase
MTVQSSTRSGFVPLGTHDIFYKRQGHGPRLLLVSGTNSDTRSNPSIYDAPGAGAFDLVNFDHRGMGQSGSPAGDPRMEDYADDIARLLDALQWEDTAVIGVSFGGMVAQHLALRHGDRVRRLALCCTSSGGAGGASYPLHRLQDGNADSYTRTVMKYMNVKHTDAWQAAHPRLAARVYDFYWQGANANFSDPVKYQAMRRQFAARARHDVYDRLGDIRIPVLVACGEDDGVAPPENSRAMANAIDGARLQIFRGGHLFLREDPHAWETVFGFLAEQD